MESVPNIRTNRDEDAFVKVEPQDSDISFSAEILESVFPASSFT